MATKIEKEKDTVTEARLTAYFQDAQFLMKRTGKTNSLLFSCLN